MGQKYSEPAVYMDYVYGEYNLSRWYPDDPYGDPYSYGEGQEILTSFPQVHDGVKAVLAVTYTLMMGICGIGNLLLCYVVYRFRRMRTTTNLLIGNLALSDFIVAVICVPFNFYYYIHQTWPFGKSMCVIVSYLKATSLYVSINSLLAIAVDRYFVITRPLHPRMTKGTTVIVLCLIWLVSMVVVIPTAMYSATPIFMLSNGNGSIAATQCVESLWSNSRAIQAYTITVTLLEFVLPLGIMSVAYFLISWRLWFRVIPGGYNTEGQERAADESRRKTVRMLMIVVMLFALCWAPYYAVAFVRDFYFMSLPEEYYSIYFTSFYFVESLAMSNCMFDTLIYVIFNANFRKCVLQLDFSRRCIPGNPYGQSVRNARSSNRRTGGTRNTARSCPEQAAVNSVLLSPALSHPASAGHNNIQLNFFPPEEDCDKHIDEQELKTVNGSCNGHNQLESEVVSSVKQEEQPISQV